MVLVYLALIGLFLCVDVLLSVTHQSTLEIDLHDIRPPIGHVPKPGLSGFFGVRFWNEFKAPFSFNEQGFRNDIPCSPETTRGQQVAFCLGDSTTACLEVPWQDSYPALLNDRLGTNWVVFNAGARAYDTHQVLLTYRERVREHRPDAVVYLICPNDYNNNVDIDHGSDYVRHYGKGVIDTNGEAVFVEPTAHGPSPRERLKKAFKTRLNLTSHILTQTARGLGRLFGRDGPVYGEAAYHTPETMATMKRLLTLFDAETAHDGVRLYLAYMPGFDRDPVTIREHPMYRAYAETRDFAAGSLTNTTFIPTFDVYLGACETHPPMKRYTFEGDPHANAAGNRWLAEAIAAGMQGDSRWSSAFLTNR